MMKQTAYVTTTLRLVDPIPWCIQAMTFKYDAKIFQVPFMVHLDNAYITCIQRQMC